MNVEGKTCVVVGAGVSGIAAAELLRRRGARVVLNDLCSADELDPTARRLEAAGVTLALGSHELAWFEGASLAVLSPGVPKSFELAATLRAVPEVLGEAELAARLSTAPLVAITGTNGKSTVTTLVGEMLKASGIETFVGGNLGVALSEAIGGPADTPDGRLVAELSSFQLETVTELRPKVAALLNVSPDHLDRYEGFEEYAKAKGNIFRAQGEGDYAVLPAGDPTTQALGPDSPAVSRHTFGGTDGEVRVQGDALVDTVTGFSVPVSDIRLRGRHNLANAAAAVLVARLAGAAPEAMAEALRTVGGLPHRAELVRELDGVSYVDDSKATNVGAAVTALEGLASPERRAVLIAGGVDKGGSYAPLMERLAQVGRAVVLIGRAAELLEGALGSLPLPVERAASMEEAVSKARSLARTGDLVLLAPACSSFDMYRSYAHRGDVFQEAVRALSGGEG